LGSTDDKLGALDLLTPNHIRSSEAIYGAAGAAPVESKINPDNLQIWLQLGRDAIAGRKSMVVTHSEIFPGTYASTTETADYLVTPTLSRTALPIDQDLFGTIDIDGQSFDSVRPHWFPWTMLFNMTGHPAISLPCGFGRDGLPIGLHLVGRFRADAELLHVSALFEASSDLLGRWPT